MRGTLPGGLPPKWVAAAALLGLAVVWLPCSGGGCRADQGCNRWRGHRREKSRPRGERRITSGRTGACGGRKQEADAREMAGRVQRIGNVMTAPDLIRFNLSGPDGASGRRSSAAPAARRQWLWPSITAGERVLRRLAADAVRASEDGTADVRAGWNGHAGPAGADRTARRRHDGDAGTRGRRGRSLRRASPPQCRNAVSAAPKLSP